MHDLILTIFKHHHNLMNIMCLTFQGTLKNALEFQFFKVQILQKVCYSKPGLNYRLLISAPRCNVYPSLQLVAGNQTEMCPFPKNDVIAPNLLICEITRCRAAMPLALLVLLIKIREIHHHNYNAKFAGIMLLCPT